MARMSIDCRNHPSESNCTISIAADDKNELIEAAVQHAVAVHGHKDSKELREMIGKSIQPAT
jgi:predicted small metal-binding protein